LRTFIPATGKTKVEIARLLGISRQQLYDITAHPDMNARAVVLR